MKKLTIKDIGRLAKIRKGKCLSKVYRNTKSKLLWKCAKNHTWNATPDNIRAGKWCPFCSGRAGTTITTLRKLAKAKGGNCLSDTYKGSATKLKWQCSIGHQWYAAPSKIKMGRWCPKCAIRNNSNKQRLGIDAMREIAQSRGGQCLSNEYINWETKLLWKCSMGHQWTAIPLSVKRGSWCPNCSSSIGERIVREYFEQIFQKPFPKVRPLWLKNKNGRMELDGYCKDLKIAFEHHGRQHYTTKTLFNKHKSNLLDRKQSDKIKRKICSRFGVRLIVIPEVISRTPLPQLQKKILLECRKAGVSIPKNIPKKISLSKAYNPKNKQYLELCYKTAINRGGQCLAKAGANRDEKLQWKCSRGHKWKARADHVVRGSWCPVCFSLKRSFKQRIGIEKIKELARQRGGVCLSKVYINARTPLTFKCKVGHQWDTAPSVIKNQGAWCPECKGLKKGTIERMISLAKTRKGRCLSLTYVNNHSPLLWQCSKGHQWEAVPSSIKSGSWCRFCAGKGPREK